MGGKYLADITADTVAGLVEGRPEVLATEEADTAVDTGELVGVEETLTDGLDRSEPGGWPGRGRRLRAELVRRQHLVEVHETVLVGLRVLEVLDTAPVGDDGWKGDWGEGTGDLLSNPAVHMNSIPRKARE